MGIGLINKGIVVFIIVLFIGTNITLTEGNILIDESQNLKCITNYYGDLKVHFIDVGQGDCILLQTPEDNFILIDTGSREYVYMVIDYLNSLSVSNILAFIVTHPHEDHLGGAQEIFEEFNIESVYHPGYYTSSQAYYRFINAAQAEGCPIFTDDNVNPGDYIQISSYLWCQILNINKDATNENDASIVLRVDYFQTSFLFTGDIHGDFGDQVEYSLVNDWNVDIDILKVTHHGSRYGTSEYFLSEATPEVSIICCGVGNQYGHPHQETLYRLQEYNSLILRTDLNGNIIVSTTGWGYNILYEKPHNQPLPPIINGNQNGATGIEYLYTAKSFDPNADRLYYLWDWGDGNITDWVGPYLSGVDVYQSHVWETEGAYIVKVKAKNTNNFESDWGYHNVLMPRVKTQKNQVLLKIFEFLLQKYLFLRCFLNLNN